MHQASMALPLQSHGMACTSPGSLARLLKGSPTFSKALVRNKATIGAGQNCSDHCVGDLRIRRHQPAEAKDVGIYAKR